MSKRSVVSLAGSSSEPWHMSGECGMPLPSREELERTARQLREMPVSPIAAAVVADVERAIDRELEDRAYRIGSREYTYLGDKLTAPELRGAHCRNVIRPDGKCVLGASKMLVLFDGERSPRVVLRRMLRRIR